MWCITVGCDILCQPTFDMALFVCNLKLRNLFCLHVEKSLLQR